MSVNNCGSSILPDSGSVGTAKSLCSCRWAVWSAVRHSQQPDLRWRIQTNTETVSNPTKHRRLRESVLLDKVTQRPESCTIAPPFIGERA